MQSDGGRQLPLTAAGSHGGALPGAIGTALEDAVVEAIGALPGVTVHRNQVRRATLPGGARVLTGIGGKGAPDLVAEVRAADGRTLLVWLECKANTGALNPDQKRWHAAAEYERRHVVIIREVADALDAVRNFQAESPIRALERRIEELTAERDGLMDVLAKSTREVTDLRAQLAGVVS
ncbi:MAG: hypothetical protein EPO40_06205 [Myxococcaceae bacterium]|nr:MAG: hypothetical protein EPO40_06205 [Myxococcaceae bacterium]